MAKKQNFSGHTRSLEQLKRLVFLNPVGGRIMGGGEMVAVEILDELAKRGWRITLVAPPGSGLFQSECLQGKVEFLPVDLAAGIGQPMAAGRAVSQIASLSHERSDAVWYGNTYRALKWLGLAKQVGGVRTVCHLHESFYQPYYYLRTRWLARYVDTFICISEAVRKEIIQGTRCERLPAVTIYNGLRAGADGAKTTGEKAALRTELGLPADQPLVCMAARSDPLKGHEVFLKMASQIVAQNPHVCFLILGGAWNEPDHPAFEDHITKLRHELGLEDTVRLLPHNSRVRDYLRAADVVVVPSLAEGFGRVAVEAMLEQTAVVASQVGGLAEILRDGQDGFLVFPGDVEQLVQSVQRLLTDEGLRRQFEQAALLRSREKFSTAAMIDQLERLLIPL